LKLLRQIAGLLIGSALVSCPAIAQTGITSSTFQVDAAHDGRVQFSESFAPPLAKRWSVNLGGLVSYPVVNGSLVTVLTTGPIGTLLVTLNTTNGKIVWRKIVDANYKDSYLASDNGKLFLTSFGGPFQAFDAATGRPLWSHQLPGQAYFNYVPVASSASVFTGGDFYGSDIYRLDEATGALHWQRVLVEPGGLGPTMGGNKVYMPIPCGVTAYAPVGGQQIWRVSTSCDVGGGLPASFYRQQLYAPTTDLSSGLPGVVIDTATGKQAGDFEGSAPAFYGSARFGISGTSLVSNDIATGKTRWSYEPKQTVTLPPIVINGNVYTLADGGTLYINSGANGRLLQSLRIGTGGATEPVQVPSSGLGVADNLLLVPSGNILAAFGP
jgi:outer membrane protein assembly factor BamB